jgi:hypothetical protein
MSMKWTLLFVAPKKMPEEAELIHPRPTFGSVARTFGWLVGWSSLSLRGRQLWQLLGACDDEDDEVVGEFGRHQRLLTQL